MYPFDSFVSCHDTRGSTRSIYRPDQRVGLADKATKETRIAPGRGVHETSRKLLHFK